MSALAHTRTHSAAHRQLRANAMQWGSVSRLSLEVRAKCDGIGETAQLGMCVCARDEETNRAVAARLNVVEGADGENEGQAVVKCFQSPKTVHINT